MSTLEIYKQTVMEYEYAQINFDMAEMSYVEIASYYLLAAKQKLSLLTEELKREEEENLNKPLPAKKNLWDRIKDTLFVLVFQV